MAGVSHWNYADIMLEAGDAICLDRERSDQL